MALSFAGISIPGFHGRVERSRPRLYTQRTHFAGIYGTSEIVLGPGERLIQVKSWVNDASLTSGAAVENLLAQYDLNVGINGALVVSGNNPRTFFNCTFEGFLPEGDIIPAVGQGMPAGTYFVVGEFFWTQLLAP